MINIDRIKQRVEQRINKRGAIEDKENFKQDVFKLLNIYNSNLSRIDKVSKAVELIVNSKNSKRELLNYSRFILEDFGENDKENKELYLKISKMVSWGVKKNLGFFN